MTTTYHSFHQAVQHYAEGNLDAAVAVAQSIAGKGELYLQAARWLTEVAQGAEAGTYVDAEAFRTFTRGGGNVGLYAAMIRIIAEVWEAHRPSTVLEIGPGDGQVIIGALDNAPRQHPPVIDLVEPATDLLAQALRGLGLRVPPVKARGFNQTIQRFMDKPPGRARWDLCEATWSLHNLPRTERAPLFRWLRDCCATLLIAEFDVQLEMYPPLSPERVRLIHDKYVSGLAEYTGQMAPDLEERVKQGFLMPMLFGQFQSDAKRSTWEQTIRQWSAEIEAGGFRVVQSKLVYPYWWADAYLLIAQA